MLRVKKSSWAFVHAFDVQCVTTADQASLAGFFFAAGFFFTGFGSSSASPEPAALAAFSASSCGQVVILIATG